MKGCFIINPKSGLTVGRGTVFPIMKKLIESGVITSARAEITQYKGHAIDIAASLDPSSCDFVMACGGDGTANEVLNGLMKSGSGIPMGILPLGTTNDFATSVGLPKDVTAVADMVKNFRVIPIDVGAFYTTDRNNAKYFLNVAAGGQLSAVAHNVPANQKNAFGRLAYLIEGAKNLSSLSLDTTPIKIDCDGTVYHENAFLFEISNSKSTGGFTKIAPSAFINDGMFNLCLIRKITPADLVPLFTKISTGTHLDDSHILCTQAHKITVSPDFGPDENYVFPLDCDGEAADNMPATIENVHNEIKLLVPNKKRSGKTLKGFEVAPLAKIN